MQSTIVSGDADFYNCVHKWILYAQKREVQCSKCGFGYTVSPEEVDETKHEIKISGKKGLIQIRY